MKRFVLFALVFVFVLAAAGCGPSEADYFDNLNATMNEYKAAQDDLNAQLDAYQAGSMEDQGWVDATYAALDRFEAAGQALSATPADQIPEKWLNLNDILVQVSDQTSVFTADMRAAIEAQDTDALVASMDQYKALGDLIQQVIDEINSVSNQ